jgi:hypothetical protein
VPEQEQFDADENADADANSNDLVLVTDPKDRELSCNSELKHRILCG